MLQVTKECRTFAAVKKFLSSGKNKADGYELAVYATPKGGKHTKPGVPTLRAFCLQ